MINCSLHKKLHTNEGVIDLDIAFSIQHAELVTLFGASGAGKTTILRMLAGLTLPDNGNITVANETWLDTSKKINLAPQKRKIGFVFQDYALFPNMSVRQNLMFPLEKNEPASLVEELMDIMDLSQLQHRKPNTLSGGQQQRVAVARALVRKPEILLLDEPLSAIDLSMRNKLQDHIIKIHRQYNLTAILVSHDLNEIQKMANRVIVIDKGKITKQGKPFEIFSSLQNGLQITAEVLNIEQQENTFIVSLLIAGSVITTTASELEIEGIKKGQQIILSANNFKNMQVTSNA